MEKQKVWCVSEWAAKIQAGEGYFFDKLKTDNLFGAEAAWIVVLKESEGQRLFKEREVFTSEAEAERALKSTLVKKVESYKKWVKNYQNDLANAEAELANIS